MQGVQSTNFEVDVQNAPLSVQPMNIVCSRRTALKHSFQVGQSGLQVEFIKAATLTMSCGEIVVLVKLLPRKDVPVNTGEPKEQSVIIEYASVDRYFLAR